MASWPGSKRESGRTGSREYSTADAASSPQAHSSIGGTQRKAGMKAVFMHTEKLQSIYHRKSWRGAALRVKIMELIPFHMRLPPVRNGLCLQEADFESEGFSFPHRTDPRSSFPVR